MSDFLLRLLGGTQGAHLPGKRAKSHWARAAQAYLRSVCAGAVPMRPR